MDAAAISLTGFSWPWILFAMTVPLPIGLLVAYPIWRAQQPILGNLAGSVVIFGAAIGLVMREHVMLDALVQACLGQGTTCWPDPSAFTRYAVYAFVGLFDVIVLFSISLRVETRMRRRHYAPEWR